MSYSQNNEEHFILQYFDGKAPSSFWDIGAFDGKTFSNTLALLERGWSGIAVEGSPVNFCNLVSNTAEHADRLHYVFGIVTDKVISSVMAWYDTDGDAVSSNDEAHVDKWSAGGMKFRKMYGAVFGWRTLLGLIPNPAFINVDVEGQSAQLAIDMWHEGLKPELWCIEHDGRADELAAMFMGYREVMRNGENIILVK